MKLMFPPDPTTFVPRLFNWLDHGGGLSAVERSDALARIGRGESLERALLDAGLPPADLVRGFLDAMGSYAIPFKGLATNQATARQIPQALALQLRLLPLVLSDDSLIAIGDANAESQPDIRVGPTSRRVVVLATTSTFEADADELYALIAQNDPGEASIADYFARRGILDPDKARALRQAQPVAGPDMWVDAALAGGASEAMVAAVQAAFVDRPLHSFERLRQFRDPGLDQRVPKAFAARSGILALREAGPHVTLLVVRMPDFDLLQRILADAGITSASAVLSTRAAFHRLLDLAYGETPSAAAPTRASRWRTCSSPWLSRSSCRRPGPRERSLSCHTAGGLRTSSSAGRRRGPGPVPRGVEPPLPATTQPPMPSASQARPGTYPPRTTTPGA